MQLSKPPDFPIMLQRLTDTGLTLGEIAEHINLSSSFVAGLRSEATAVPVSWFSVWNLLDLYCRACGTPVPFYGNHNE
jgi:hypothetical protein